MARRGHRGRRGVPLPAITPPYRCICDFPVTTQNTTENTGTPGKLSPKTVETQHSCQKLPGRRNRAESWLIASYSATAKLAHARPLKKISSRAAAETLLNAEVNGCGEVISADTAFALRLPATLRGWPACDFFGGSKPIWRQGFRRGAIRCCGRDGARDGVPGWPVPQAVSQRADGGNLSKSPFNACPGPPAQPQPLRTWLPGASDGEPAPSRAAVARTLGFSPA